VFSLFFFSFGVGPIRVARFVLQLHRCGSMG